MSKSSSGPLISSNKTEEEGKGHDNRNIAPQETTKKKIRAEASSGKGQSWWCKLIKTKPSGETKKLKGGDRQHSFSYDPKSHARNFDEGNLDQDDDPHPPRFASRYASNFFSIDQEKK